MRITNRYNLPEAIVRGTRAIQAQYNNGGADISVTQLISAPRINILRKKHFADMEKDISEEWFATFGSAVHYILSLGAGPNDIVEERIHLNVNGTHVSGAIDLQELETDGSVSIRDYKVCSVYAVQKGSREGKSEWENQLNVLAFLVEEAKGIPVKRLEIVAIIRDWQRTQAQTDPEYPICPIVSVPINLWSKEQRYDYVRGKVAEYQQAQMAHDFGEELPLCSATDRWAAGDKWAVWKPGNKKASKVFTSLVEAELYVAENATDKKPLEIEYRPGKPIRCCNDYCGVARWCNQWASDPHHPRNNNGNMEADTGV